MQAADNYFSLLKQFINTTWQAWSEEIDQMDLYILEQKKKGQKTVYLEIRKGNQIKKMQAIKELLSAASEAINHTPKHLPTQTSLEFKDNDNYLRKRIIDMPAYSDEKLLLQIYKMVEKIETKL
jgi:hypothetical protein